MSLENDQENRVTMEDDTNTEANYDQEGRIGQGVGLEDACPHDLDSEPVNKMEVMNIEEEGELNIQEKCSFDNPEYRRESVMKHAQRLFRDARRKLKRKYFNDIRLKTKEEHLRNKPSEMTKVQWRFLVDHWSDEKFEEKSKKASESNQKMPHYNEPKSFARLRQETRQTNEGKCSRVDVLVASRMRKSKKADVLGKDTHVYLRAYGPGKIITQHIKVKPTRLDLSQELIKVKKKEDQLIDEARKDAENAKTEAEQAKKETEAVRNDMDRKIEQNQCNLGKKVPPTYGFYRRGTYSNDDDSGNESSSR
ncbi:tRNA dimethylallyltransferase [Bienertia sinuspersici]